MQGDRYTRGEVLYLLSLTRGDAIEDDEGYVDSCARFSADGNLASTTHAEWDPLMTIARWNDVHGARARVIAQRMEAASCNPREIQFETVILILRARGHTEEEIAERTGLHRLAARRRFTAATNAILEELGGEVLVDEDDMPSTVPACMRCARRPRARVQERRRRIRGGSRILAPERLSSLCVQCTPEDQLKHLVATATVRAWLAA